MSSAKDNESGRALRGQTGVAMSTARAAQTSPSVGRLFIGREAEQSRPALRWREAGGWKTMSYAQLGARCREIARGLIALGIEPGDRVAILSNTRHEWTLADGGVLCAAATVVPIYHTNSPEECAYVLNHSGARAVFCEDAEQLAKIEAVRSKCPALENVIAMTAAGDGVLTVDELRVGGFGIPKRVVDDRLDEIGADAVATIVYTSGTTGPPKGCMLTHGNWSATVDMYVERMELTGGAFFLFLPLAHVMARIIQMFTLGLGATLIYWQRDPAILLDDLRDANPTHFPSVPRMFEKIYTAATVGIAAQSPVKRAVFKWAIATGARHRRHERAGEPIGPFLRHEHRLADRLVLSKIRALFGRQLEFAISAAAPIAADVLEFFDAAGVRVLEAYGMTETTAAGAINTLDEWRVGTVGRPLLPGEIKVAGDGEILMRGPHVFSGYFNDPVATDAAFDGEWLRTGDLGSIAGDGYVSITGRKKDIIITSSGKNITPANIENALKESRWISEAVVYGDDKPYLVVLLTLDPDELPALAETSGAAADSASMAIDERVREIVQRDVDATNERFARIEQVKRFRILGHDLTQEHGELTPTLKVKRRVVYDRYAEEIARLYE